MYTSETDCLIIQYVCSIRNQYVLMGGEAAILTSQAKVAKWKDAQRCYTTCGVLKLGTYPHTTWMASLIKIASTNPELGGYNNQVQDVANVVVTGVYRNKRVLPPGGVTSCGFRDRF